jgi:hypothetical protein
MGAFHSKPLSTGKALPLPHGMKEKWHDSAEAAAGSSDAG